MIKGFYFSLSFNWLAKKRSIREISERLISLFKALSQIDRRFSTPIFLSNYDGKIEVGVHDANAVNNLAGLILLSAKADILRYDKISEPDIDFSRDFGFSLSFGFENQSITVAGRLGSSEAEGLAFSFPKEFEEKREWYLKLLKCVVKNTSAFFGSMQLKVTDVTRQIADIKYPLGLVTFYSSTLPFSIEEYLVEIRIEKEEQGIYAIVSEHEVTASKESFEIFKANLLRQNDILRQKIPEIIRNGQV